MKKVYTRAEVFDFGTLEELTSGGSKTGKESSQNARN